MLCGMGPHGDGLLIGTARIVPHCSIALHWSSIEWGFSKITPSLFTLKEGSTAFPKPLSPQGTGDVTALRCSEPLRYKVDGASEPSPCCAGWDRMGIRHITNTASPLFYKQLHVSVFEKSYILFLIAVSLCTGRRSNEESSGLWQQ